MQITFPGRGTSGRNRSAATGIGSPAGCAPGPPPAGGFRPGQPLGGDVPTELGRSGERSRVGTLDTDEQRGAFVADGSEAHGGVSWRFGRAGSARSRTVSSSAFACGARRTSDTRPKERSVADTGTIGGTHHLTMCVGPAQEDYDFHVRELGLRSVKKTVLFAGGTPVFP